jgi:hypothetical protein
LGIWAGFSRLAHSESGHAALQKRLGHQGNPVLHLRFLASLPHGATPVAHPRWTDAANDRKQTRICQAMFTSISIDTLSEPI